MVLPQNGGSFLKNWEILVFEKLQWDFLNCYYLTGKLFIIWNFHLTSFSWSYVPNGKTYSGIMFNYRIGRCVFLLKQDIAMGLESTTIYFVNHHSVTQANWPAWLNGWVFVYEVVVSWNSVSFTKSSDIAPVSDNYRV